MLRRVEVLAILFRLRRAAGHHGAEQEPRGEEAEGERLDLRPEWVPPREGPKRHRAGAGEPGSRRVRGTAPGGILRSTKEQQPFCFRSGAHAVQPASPPTEPSPPQAAPDSIRVSMCLRTCVTPTCRVSGARALDLDHPTSRQVSSEAATLSTVTVHWLHYPLFSVCNAHVPRIRGESPRPGSYTSSSEAPPFSIYFYFILCGSCLVSLPSSHQDCIQETTTCGRSASQSRQRAPLAPLMSCPQPTLKTARRAPAWPARQHPRRRNLRRWH